MKRSLDTLYCSLCGSSDIKINIWVNPNDVQIRSPFNSQSEIAIEDSYCNCCEEYSMEVKTLKELWDDFSEIPVNNDDEIEEDFMHFEAGTPKLDVWHWFDERCPNNLHDDLMYPTEKEG